MLSYAKHLFRRAFGVYPGEVKKTLHFVRLASVWAFGSCIASTLSMGLFIENVGARFLPGTYMVTALTMMMISCLFIYFLRITTPYRIMTTIMSIAIVFYMIISFSFLHGHQRWFWFFLQIISYSLEPALLACFWTFADQYHDLQDAKRMYGIYNAGYFLGFMISGTIINLTYDKLGPSFLYGLICLTLTYSIYEIRKITKNIPKLDDDTSEDFFSGGKKSIRSILELFYKSPFAISLIGMSLTIQVLKTFTEFNYMDTFGTIFTHVSNNLRADSVTEFLAKCKAFIAAGNIIFGMFFYRGLIRKVGLGNMILLPPLFFMIVYSEWVAYNMLFIAVLAVIAVEGILYTLEDNNFNLLITAAPAKLRGAVRIINDSFFEPIGMLFSSIILFFVRSNNNKWFGLVLAFIFLAVSIFVRYFYPKSIFINLKQNAIHFERKIRDWLAKCNKKEQLEIKNDLIKGLNSADNSLQLLTCDTLLSFNDPSLLDLLIERFNSFNFLEKIKILKILENSSFNNEPKIIDMIDNWIEFSENNELLKHCSLYLGKCGLLHPEKVHKDLDSLDLYERASAIITLKNSYANKSLPNASLNRTIANKETDLLFQFNDENEICMGLEILSKDTSNESIEKVLKYLSSSNLKIKQKAADSLSKITDQTDNIHLGKIIEELKNCSDNSFRLNLLKSLGNIGDSSVVKEIILLSNHFRPNERRMTERIITKIGLKTVPILLTITKDISIHERGRILAAKILGNLSLAQLKANLDDIISIEIEKAYFYFYYGNTIQKHYPLYDLSLLENALLSGFQSVIDFIIHLIGATSPIEDCDLIVRTLHSKNPKAHAHAIETLEKNCDEAIFKLVRPLIDDLPYEYRIEAYHKLIKESSYLSLEALLNKLEKSSSFFDKIIAVHLKAKLSMPDWKHSLREQIKSNDEAFHHLTYELLES